MVVISMHDTTGGRHHMIKLLAWDECAQLSQLFPNKPAMLVFELAAMLLSKCLK